MTDVPILYGSPLSLYTGKARSYLIKNNIPYREIRPGSEHYEDHVLPLARARTMPILETAGGKIIRDSTAIIDHFEQSSGYSSQPSTPKQAMVSRLFDVIGAEGLLRPAMHYRWNFDEENIEFITFSFTLGVEDEGRKKAILGFMDRMRMMAVAFGASPENHATIESLYEELLDKLNDHFASYPYLLGYKPCIGDFGLIAPLYAHLGRDPAPLRLMQQRAPRVFRWVERMNRPDPDVGEFPAANLEFIGDDVIPETLVAVLKHVAEDFVPETIAAADCVNDWLASQEALAVGTPIERGVGMGTYTVRGLEFQSLAQPYRFYLLRRIQDRYAELDEAETGDVDRLFQASGMKAVLGATINRVIGRENNLEVWL